MSHYCNVILAGDIMFVNKIPFFLTISQSIKFGTAEMIKDQKAKTILAAIKQVWSVYRKRGFNITTMLMDGQFEVIRADVAELGITINASANDEHVTDVERYIRTIKERVRAVFNTLPFSCLPDRIAGLLRHILAK
jgi:acetolactate synthase regulatory subunit